MVAASNLLDYICKLGEFILLEPPVCHRRNGGQRSTYKVVVNVYRDSLNKTSPHTARCIGGDQEKEIIGSILIPLKPG